MKDEDEVAGVDDFLRAQEDKSRDLSTQQRDERAQPGDLPPGAAVAARDEPGRD